MRIFRICPGFLIPSVCLNFIYQTRIRLVSACEDVTLFTARRPRLVARQTGKEHNMKDIKWTIQYDRPPASLRHCKKCNSRQEFGSSGQFRVNAQGTVSYTHLLHVLQTLTYINKERDWKW